MWYNEDFNNPVFVESFKDWCVTPENLENKVYRYNDKMVKYVRCAMKIMLDKNFKMVGEDAINEISAKYLQLKFFTIMLECASKKIQKCNLENKYIDFFYKNELYCLYKIVNMNVEEILHDKDFELVIKKVLLV